MENIIISLEAITPMFCMIFIGVLIKKYRMLTPDELKHINRMVFSVFFSIMMFYNIYTTKLQEALQLNLIAFVTVALLVIFTLSYLVVMRIEQSNKRRGAMIQAIYRSNFVLMGMPIVANIYGSGNIGVTATLVAVVVPLYNILAVFVLETFRGGSFNLGRIIISVLKNPMILGALSGFMASAVSLPLPQVIVNTMGQIAAATMPIALMMLGASFRLGSTHEHMTALRVCIIGRLIVVPAIGLSMAWCLGFRGVEFVSLVGLFCSPCAVASYTMAQQMDSDSELAGNCVIFSSALSCLTIFCWLLLSRELGLF